MGLYQQEHFGRSKTFCMYHQLDFFFFFQGPEPQKIVYILLHLFLTCWLPSPSLYLNVHTTLFPHLSRCTPKSTITLITLVSKLVVEMDYLLGLVQFRFKKKKSTSYTLFYKRHQEEKYPTQYHKR